ncbi:nitrate reductase cytochrome c-type subunit [Thioalkalivibrio paradoxus]|uniref:Periplasmic nitrate reductase, electron transfer subunit n=1 Tax=Thioalkalivibrio paradoxus ARh 1 TaxID=713585 RepID=W0DMB7_9GAMM|nr:nitrate reductase cytochrome c-type subunit [Thioalkalivibrio paradoxus]AHE98133.1 nitrate reductase [Thioalkalivibrio paradoxus ARh 1]
MKSRAFPGIALLALFALSPAHAGDDALDPDRMGLSPVSVFEIPAPDAFTFPDTRPGSGETLPRGFPGAPPQVPHRIETYLPITLQSNRCLGCHDDLEMIGQELAVDDPTPMPKTHYMQVEDRLVPSGENHVCTHCHVPQADVPPLTGSTF